MTINTKTIGSLLEDDIETCVHNIRTLLNARELIDGDSDMAETAVAEIEANIASLSDHIAVAAGEITKHASE